jgi:DNA-3-methyladenine glycosylase I
MTMHNTPVARCGWANSDPVYMRYHDEDWGTPVHDDRKWFEMVSLEGAQAGLSWITILKRREAYLTAFDNFEPRIVAQYDEARIATLLNNAGIIRNQLKIRSVVKNAQAFLKVQAEFGTFDAYIWRFVNGEPIINCFAALAEVPPKTPVSDVLSKDLRKRGFTFVGSTICYALMQSCGLVNDHVQTCFRYPCT